MKKEILETETAPSPMRFKLRLKILGGGYRRYKDFAAKLGCSPGRLSRILNGHEFPSKVMQRHLAEALNLTLPELKRLL
jgi:transcriptional regulator with XRE-family HTH domain